MAATMIPTARITMLAVQNLLNSISNMRYSNATSITLSTNTKLPSVHILLTKPNPTVGLDSCTRVELDETPTSSAVTTMMSKITKSTPYTQPGKGLWGCWGVTSLASTFLAQSLKWGFTVVVLLVFSLIRLFPYVTFQGHIVAAEPWKIHSSTIFLTVS